MGLVDAQTLILNFSLILGGVLLLIVGFFTFMATWSVTFAVIGMIRQKRSFVRWRRSALRADGKPYPSFIEGQCQQCKRGDRKVYFLEDGHELCPSCYETYWRLAENFVDPEPPTVRSALSPVRSPRKRPSGIQ